MPIISLNSGQPPKRVVGRVDDHQADLAALDVASIERLLKLGFGQGAPVVIAQDHVVLVQVRRKGHGVLDRAWLVALLQVGETSTVNRPPVLQGLLDTGVVARQLWLFWPSMISTLTLSASAARAGSAISAPEGEIETSAKNRCVMSVFPVRAGTKLGSPKRRRGGKASLAALGLVWFSIEAFVISSWNR